MKVDIRQLYQSPNASTEPFELSGKGWQIQGELTRLDEGILAHFDLKTQTKTNCVRCTKLLNLTLDIQDSEWLFYDKPPKDFDDMNELLRIDKNKMEIAFKDILRQEILLNSPDRPHCDPICKQFEDDSPSGIKALSGLKDLI